MGTENFANFGRFRESLCFEKLNSLYLQIFLPGKYSDFLHLRMSMTFFRELKKNLPRLHLKNCSFAVTQPNQLWRRQLKIFYWISESNFLSWKTFPKVTDHFNVKFYFSNAYLNSAEHYIISFNKKLKEQTHGVKFKSVLFCL